MAIATSTALLLTTVAAAGVAARQQHLAQNRSKREAEKAAQLVDPEVLRRNAETRSARARERARGGFGVSATNLTGGLGGLGTKGTKQALGT